MVEKAIEVDKKKLKGFLLLLLLSILISIFLIVNINNIEEEKYLNINLCDELNKNESSYIRYEGSFIIWGNHKLKKDEVLLNCEFERQVKFINNQSMN